MPPREPVLVLFDGDCSLCSASVNFIIDRDPAARFRFASQQSAFGQQVLAKYRQPNLLSTVVVIDRGRAYARSAAVLRIARNLPWPWPALQLGAVIPRPVADWLYERVAMNRYRLFGRAATCRMPTSELAGRIIG
jgi:predicted DCC family thiol-disulfide oxidoreductase YuxK